MLENILILLIIICFIIFIIKKIRANKYGKEKIQSFLSLTDYIPCQYYLKKEKIKFNLNPNILLNENNNNYKILRDFVKNFENKYNYFDYFVDKKQKEEKKQLINIILFTLLLLIVTFIFGDEISLFIEQVEKSITNISDKIIEFMINSYVAIIPFFVYLIYTIYGDKTVNTFYGIRYGVIMMRIGNIEYKKIIFILISLFPINLLLYLFNLKYVIIASYIVVIIFLLYFSYLYFKTRYNFNELEYNEVKDILIMNNLLHFCVYDDRIYVNDNIYIKEYNESLFLYVIYAQNLNTFEITKLCNLLSDLFFAAIFKYEQIFNYETNNEEAEWLIYNTIIDYFEYHKKALIEFLKRNDYYYFNKFIILYQENLIMLFHALLQSDNSMLKHFLINYILDCNVELEDNINYVEHSDRYLKLLKDVNLLLTKINQYLKK